MALIRWNPNNDLFDLHSELDRVFTDLTQGLLPGQGNGGTRFAEAFLPLDISRTDKQLEIEASVLGFRPEDVSVTLDGGVLTISAQRSVESENADKNYVRKERHSGRLYRQVVLGEEVDGDKVQATFKDGVLKIAAPLLRKPEPKRITVSSG